MAESGVLSSHQQAHLGKGALIESYQSAGVFDGLMEVITDTNQRFPKVGKPVVLRRDLVANSGLSQKICMIGKLTGEGIDEDQTLEGKEQELETYTQQVYIRLKRHAVRTAGMQDEQSSPIKLYPHFKPQLAEWQGNIRTKEIIRKLAGATTKTFSNTPVAASSYRVVYGGDATATTDIDSADEFGVTEVARAITLAKNEYKTGTDGEYIPAIAPCNFGGKGRFYLLLTHPDAFDAIWESARVQQMLREAEQYQKNSPLIKGGDLHYKGTIIRPCEHLREANAGQFSNWGSGSATAGCINLFLGAGAAAVSESNNPEYITQHWDYKNKRAVGIACIWGTQKAKYNGQDLGTIAIKTYYTSL